MRAFPRLRDVALDDAVAVLAFVGSAAVALLLMAASVATAGVELVKDGSLRRRA